MKKSGIYFFLGIFFLIALNTRILSKDYVFIVVQDKVYRGNERTGKITQVTTDHGTIWGYNDN